MDMISAALGLEYGSDEEMRALAEKLRKEKRAADVFSLSPTFEKQAAAQQQNIMQSAERAGLARARQLQQDAYSEEREAQRRFTEEQNALNRDNALKLAGMRSGGIDPRLGYDPSKPFGSLKTSKERERFQTVASDLASTDLLAENYKDEYGPMIPGTGEIENFIGQYLPENMGLAEQSNFWSNFEAFHNMPKRHNIFGSAFTKVEQEAWNRAYFNANTKPEVAKNRLRILQHMSRRLAEKQVIDAYEANVNPDIIENQYGDLIDVPALLDTWENNRAAYQEKRKQDLITAGAFLKDEGVDEKTISSMIGGAVDTLMGNEEKPIEEMTDEELWELGYG